MVKKVLIGCDPEFVISSGKGCIPAEAIISDYRKHNTIGVDMADMVAELRPPPSDNMFVLVARLRRLLKHMLDKRPELKDYKFVAGHYAQGEAIGGHIHINICGWSNFTPRFRVFLNKIIYVGFLGVLNDKGNHRRRNHHMYGYPSDFRTAIRCGETVLEYRSPPSWLVNPTMAFIYLTLAKMCAMLYAHNINLSNVDTIITSQAVGKRLLMLLVKTAKKYPDIVKEHDVSKCIELLQNLPESINIKTWNKDFKKNWNL